MTITNELKYGVLKAGVKHCAVLAALVLGLQGCVIVPQNTPRNVALDAGATYSRVMPPTDINDELVVAASFSGGGLRAAAYAQGVMEGLEALPGKPGRSLLDELTFITSVSGGSLTAAYYGLYGKAALHQFREKVLLRDGEENLHFNLLNPRNVLRLLGGGLNDRQSLYSWLDEDVFKHATFADLYRRGKPQVWINATNLYYRLPFPFYEPAFAALCSDLSQFPVADAVYASMAVPLVFAPLVLEKFPDNCVHRPLPAKMVDQLNNPSVPLVLKSIIRSVRDMRESTTGKYIKLADGGLTDNFGLSTLQHMRLLSGTPYGPMTQKDAVKLRKLLFVVVDAGQSPGGDWTRRLEGPSGLELASAAIDTAIDTNARTSFDAFMLMMKTWQEDLVRYRCALSPQELATLRGKPFSKDSKAEKAKLDNWRCDDVQFTVSRVAFDDFEPAMTAKLGAIPTRLKLPVEQIDQLIQAGRDSVQRNAVIQTFQQSLSPAH